MSGRIEGGGGMTDQEKEVLSIIKLRLGIEDETKDALIISYIYEIGRRILHYCQRSDIPDGMNWVWASMVIDALKAEIPDQFGGGDIAGLSVKIGDTSVSPANSSSEKVKTSIDQIVFNYKADLHRWRKLRW